LLIDRALELDENLAVAWQRSGRVHGYAGDSERAIDSLKRAIRLEPLDPRMFLTQSAMGFAHFIAGRDDEAADWAEMALRVSGEEARLGATWIASSRMRSGRARRPTFRKSPAEAGLGEEVDMRRACRPD